MAELSNYNCSISYRSGKQNADADGLSRLHGSETVSTLFPEVLKATVQALNVEQEPYIESPCNAEQACQTDLDESSEVPEEILQSTAFKKQDWRTAQSANKNLQFVLDCLIEGHQPSAEEAVQKCIDKRYVINWKRYNLKNGVLHKSGKIGEEAVNRLCLPSSLKLDIFTAYHNDLGHQGKERTLSLLKRRFYWPGMDKDVQNMIHQCGR